MNLINQNNIFILLKRISVFIAFIIISMNASAMYADVNSFGEENSWFRIHNVGKKTAEVEILFYDESGKMIAEDGCNITSQCKNIGPEKSRTFFQQSKEGLEIGFRGSAFVTSTQPFVTLMGRDAFKNDKFQIAGDTLRLLPNGPNQILPIVISDTDFTSRISIQNLNKENAGCMELLIYSINGLIETNNFLPINSGLCPNGGISIMPRSSITIDEKFFSKFENFDGFGIIYARTSAEGFLAENQSYMATIETRENFGTGLTQYRSIDFEETSTDIVLPVADKNSFEQGRYWDVKFRIVNKDVSSTNKINFLFQGVDDENNYYEFEHSLTITEMLTCDLRLWNQSDCIPNDIPFIDSFRGTVRIKGEKEIAVVAQLFSSNNLIGDYRGFSAEEASRQIFMPVLNKGYGPFGGSQGWNSSFRLFTFDGQSSTIKQFYFSNKQGNIDAPSQLINREKSFIQSNNSLLPNKWVGSGYIVADKPVVAVVYLMNENFKGDNLIMYNSVSLE